MSTVELHLFEHTGEPRRSNNEGPLFSYPFICLDNER